MKVYVNDRLALPAEIERLRKILPAEVLEAGKTIRHFTIDFCQEKEKGAKNANLNQISV